MQNNIIIKISPTVRLISLFILCCSLFLANSIFLVLFITTLTIIMILITNQKVNSYVNIIKKSKILLLFLLIVYIIISKNDIFNIFIFMYKLIVVVLLFSIFFFNTSFAELHQSVYGCLKSLEKFNLNIEQFSYDFTLALYFFKILVDKKDTIMSIQRNNVKKQINIKNFFFPIFINSISELNEFQNNLTIKFYKLKKSTNNKFSNFVLLIAIVLFVFVVFKEVIL